MIEFRLELKVSLSHEGVSISPWIETVSCFVDDFLRRLITAIECHKRRNNVLLVESQLVDVMITIDFDVYTCEFVKACLSATF